MTTRWYVVQSLPHGEFIAVQSLLKGGFETFLPLYRRMTKKRTVLISENVPLFPGYLFALFDQAEGMWRTIFRMHGVRTLLATSYETPRPVPVGIIEQLQRQSSLGGFIEVNGNGPEASYAPGSQLEIMEGPFKGFTGTCVSAERARVRILLDILGTEKITSIPVSQVACAI